eukprot:305643-Chlamydomonas_euryale.AAC.2
MQRARAVPFPPPPSSGTSRTFPPPAPPPPSRFRVRIFSLSPAQPMASDMGMGMASDIPCFLARMLGMRWRTRSCSWTRNSVRKGWTRTRMCGRGGPALA